MKLMTLLLGVALVFGVFVVDTHAQTPAAPPAQQGGASQPSPGAADKATTPQGTPTPEVRGERPPAAQQPPNVTIDNRSQTRGGGERGKFLGVDPTVAMVIGAALVVVIVIALVAMSKRTEDIPTHRSV